jgi:DNA-binding response OmpR family regulator
MALDGHEVVRIIRSPDDFPQADIPIILMTDDGSVARIAKALLIGAHEILLKPFSPRALEQRLRSILKRPRPMVRSQGRYFPEPRQGSWIDAIPALRASALGSKPRV